MLAGGQARRYVRMTRGTDDADAKAAAAKEPPLTVALPGGQALEFVLIPPGEFMMGSEENKVTNRYWGYSTGLSLPYLPAISASTAAAVVVRSGMQEIWRFQIAVASARPTPARRLAQ